MEDVQNVKVPIGIDSHLGLPNEGGPIVNPAKPAQGLEARSPQGELDPLAHGYDSPFLVPEFLKSRGLFLNIILL